MQPPAYLRNVTGRPGADEWNAMAVAHHRDRSLTDVRAEFERIAGLIIEQAGRRSDDEMNATDTLAYAGTGPLWRKIGGETFLHWPAHSSDLERAVTSTSRNG
jgi:hypothetical protein